MSFNRENIIWQSADGTWNRGFYEVAWQGDGDPEWDVEYGGEFWWVSIGHPSQEAAHSAWDGSNPGGYTMVSHADHPDAADRLDDMARRVLTAPRHAQWSPTIHVDLDKNG